MSKTIISESEIMTVQQAEKISVLFWGDVTTSCLTSPWESRRIATVFRNILAALY